MMHTVFLFKKHSFPKHTTKSFFARFALSFVHFLPQKKYQKLLFVRCARGFYKNTTQRFFSADIEGETKNTGCLLSGFDF